MTTKAWTNEHHPAVPGPWSAEPDKVQWVDPATGLDCLIVRNLSGALCGYVGVPPGHPWHGVGYEDLEDVTIHGGLTFSDSCQEDAPEGQGVCHIPEPGRAADVWWLGFDCAHGGVDRIPLMEEFRHLDYPLMPGWPEPVYRDLGYVTGQCEQLAVQVHAVAVAS